MEGVGCEPVCSPEDVRMATARTQHQPRGKFSEVKVRRHNYPRKRKPKGVNERASDTSEAKEEEDVSIDGQESEMQAPDSDKSKQQQIGYHQK